MGGSAGSQPSWHQGGGGRRLKRGSARHCGTDGAVRGRKRGRHEPTTPSALGAQQKARVEQRVSGMTCHGGELSGPLPASDAGTGCRARLRSGPWDVWQACRG